MTSPTETEPEPAPPVAGHRFRTRPAENAPAQQPRRRVDLAGLAVWTTLTQLVLPVTSLISGPVLARELGPTGRGIYAAALSPVLVLSFIAHVGLPDATTYAVARLRLPRGHVLITTSKLTVVYGLAGAGLIYALAPDILKKTPQAVPLMRQLALTLPLLMILNLLRQATASSADFRWRNIERVVMSMVRLFGILGLAVVGWLTATSGAWVTMVSGLIGLPLLLIAVFGWRLQRLREDPKTRREYPHLMRGLARYGVRGWPGTFAYLVNWRLDQAVMVVLVSAKQLGYYAVAVSLAELPQTAFLQLKNVLFAESAARDDMTLIARASRILIAITTVLSVLGMLASIVVVPLLFGHKFRPAVGMAQILLAGTIPFLIDAVLGAGLLSMGRPGRRSVGQLIAAFVTVSGLVVLCPRIGAIGASWTSLAAYSVSALITATIFCRQTGFTYRQVFVLTREDAVWLRKRAGQLRRKLGKAGGRLRPARSN